MKDSSRVPRFAAGSWTVSAQNSLGLLCVVLMAMGPVLVSCNTRSPVLDEASDIESATTVAAQTESTSVEQTPYPLSDGRVGMYGILGVTVDLEHPEGIRIISVEPGLPAEQAEILPDDVIVSIDGKPIIENREGFRRLQGLAGASVVLEILRPATSETYTAEIKRAPRNQPVKEYISWKAITVASQVNEFAWQNSTLWMLYNYGIASWDMKTGAYTLFPVETHGFELATDTHGAKWLATPEDGMFHSIDGRNWLHIPYPDLDDTHPQDLLVAANDWVWVLFGHEVAIFQDNDWTVYNVASGIDDFLTRLVITEPNAIWVIGRNGIHAKKDKTWVSHPYPKTIFGIPSVASGPNGQLWIALGSEIYKFDGSSWNQLEPIPSGAYVQSLLTDTDGKVLAQADEGIFRYDGTTWRHLIDVPDKYRTRVVKASLGRIIVLHNDLTVEVLTGPDYTMRKVYWSPIGYETGDILVTDRGELWLEHPMGIARYADGCWQVYTPENGLAHEAMTDIAQTKEGTVWVTTWWGVSRFDGRSWQTFRVEDGLAHNNVFCVAIDAKGVAWFGGPGGVSSFDGDLWTNYTSVDGLPDNTVLDIAVGPNDEKWFVTKYGGLSRFSDGDWEVFSIPFDLTTDVSPALVVDRDSTVWLSTPYGLASFDDGKNWRTWTDIPIYSLSLDKIGRVWAGGFSSIHRYENGVWLTFRTYGREITSIDFDELHHGWLTTPTALVEMEIIPEFVSTEVEIVNGALKLANLPVDLLTFSSLSPNGYYDIFGLDMNSKSILNLTDCQGHSTYPAWSPSGRELLFRHKFPDSGDADLFIHKVGESTTHRLTYLGACCASWSYDGDYVAYVANDNVFVQNLATGLLERAGMDTSTHFYLDWSPVSDILAASRTLNGIMIYTVAPRATPVVREYQHFGTSRALFAWSPDGKWLAYELAVSYGISPIAIRELDGDRTYTILGKDPNTNTTLSLGVPAWHPDGKRIAYCGYGGYGGDYVFVQDVEDDQSVRLVSVGHVVAMKWSPNGEWLAVVRRERDNWQLIVLDSNTYEILATQDLDIDPNHFGGESYAAQIRWRPR